MHVPAGADVDIVEVDRGGKSTYHAPGQLVCYPIFDLTRHGQDVKRYCRDLESAIVQTLGAFGLAGTCIEGLTGVWLEAPPTKDRVDRDPPDEMDLDARLRVERRSRPGAVHGLDHRLRARRPCVHLDGARARQAVAGGRRSSCGSAGAGRRVRARLRRRPGARRHHLRFSVRPPADHLPMEATLRLLAWVGVVAAASLGTAIAIGVLIGSI